MPRGDAGAFDVAMILRRGAVAGSDPESEGSRFSEVIRCARPVLSNDYKVLVLSGMGYSEDNTKPEDHVLDLGKGLRTLLYNHVVLGVNPSDFGCTKSSTPPEIDWGQGAPPDSSTTVLDALEAILKSQERYADSDN